MAKAITSEKFALGTSEHPARFSFVSLDRPKKFAGNDGGPGKYQLTALLDPTVPAHKAQILALSDMVKKLLADGGVDNADLKSKAIGKGDTKKYAGWAGRIFVGPLCSDILIPIVGRRRQPVKPGDKEFPFSGAYGIVKGTFWLQNNTFGKRVNGNLLTVQFVQPGEPFGREAADPEEEFEALDDLPEDKKGGSSIADDDIPF